MKTRREFLRDAALLNAGLVGSSVWSAYAQMRGGRRGMRMGMGAGAAMDPPPGPPLTDPPVLANVSTVAGRVEVNLEAKVAPVSVGGKTANLLTYNGQYPGPTIRARIGDRLKVNMKNSIPTQGTNALGHDRSITNLHTHGLHVSPMGNSDNAMVIIKPGEKFVYEYDLSKENQGALHIYHPHIHGAVAEQIWGGLAGAIDIVDEDKTLADYETHLLIVRDLGLNGTEPEQFTMMDYMMGKEGDMVTVNGLVNPVLSIRPGQVQRWRILNISNARFYKLSLENHQFHVVGTDAGLLDKPYPMSSILLAPAERVDILIKADQSPKNYRFLSLPYNRGCMRMGGSGQITLMTLSYKGNAANDRLPTAVNPAAVRLNKEPKKTEQLILSMGMMGGDMMSGDMMGMMGGGMMGMGGRGMGGMGMGRGQSGGDSMSQGKGSMGTMKQGSGSGMNMGMRGYINGVSFEMMEGMKMSAFTIKSELGTYEVWEIVNRSCMDHPFHQHVNHSQVLSIEGGDPEYASFYTSAPALKDVVVVPRMGRAKILLPVTDYAGMCMFHCHIVEHEDIGMMGLWEIGPEGTGHSNMKM